MGALEPLLRRWPALAALASALMLAAAHGFQRFGALAPCTLCYRQREVYWAALAIAVAGLIAMRLRPVPWARRTLCFVLAAVFLYGAGLAAYHAGVEWKWWPGPTTCTGVGSVSADAIADLLAGKPIRGPSCDQAAWVWMGLSMAGWNALASLGLSIASLAAGLWRPRHG